MSKESEKYYAQKRKKELEKVTVNKKKYLLLTLFLGFIGIHKFYAKKPQLGILYLLISFTFIPLLISFYEFFSTLKIKSDEKGEIRI